MLGAIAGAIIGSIDETVPIRGRLDDGLPGVVERCYRTLGSGA
ncbi:MAG: hypothetical protein ACREIR_18345 [Geminicoccaceae bacterium]